MLGSQLRVLRVSQGLTLRQAAKKAGTSAAGFCKAENSNNPKAKYFEALGAKLVVITPEGEQL
ncbi:helix-turn-helix domain-containing protein [Ferrimonas balearica]|uniref:helix-turn-helix domain-containing protein n=1 Tax=Ferrimonas balearica TaxID=44012 RepID=UPI001C99463F|nr:helix-turn-helix transcriptional regulator [Ferrimonas balearica]MBY5920403.1 helix-turn-helix domain-containing protein [Ferrimonas balearica]MBY5996912.1 helix-turn-helix domain-containing protein [Ferrimonas balearica]